MKSFCKMMTRLMAGIALVLAMQAPALLPAKAGPSDHATLKNPGGGPPADLKPFVNSLGQRFTVPGNGWFSGDDVPANNDPSLWRNFAGPAINAPGILSMPGAGPFDGDKPTRACHAVVRDAQYPDGTPVQIGATQCYNASNQAYIVPDSEHILGGN